MGTEKGSPTDLIDKVVDGCSPSHDPPSSPEEDDVIIDVDGFFGDPSKTTHFRGVGYMTDVDLSSVAGPSTIPYPGPSQYLECHRSGKRKLLPRMSTPLPKKKS